MALSHASCVKLVTCHPSIKKVVWAVSDEMPIVVVCGYRNREDQEKAFNEGKSKAHWLESPHNFEPSRAIDLAPLIKGKIEWENIEAFQKMGELVMRKASELGVSLTWGKHFKIVDYPHFELRDWDGSTIK